MLKVKITKAHATKVRHGIVHHITNKHHWYYLGGGAFLFCKETGIAFSAEFLKELLKSHL